MRHFDEATEHLENSDRDKQSQEIGNLLPKEVIEGYWTWKILGEFEDDFLEDVLSTEASVRNEISDRTRHVNEQMMEERMKEEYED